MQHILKRYGRSFVAGNLVALVAILFSASAWAQEAAEQVSSLADDPARLAAIGLDAVQSKNWWLLAGTALMGVIFAIRTFGPKLVPALGAFLLHPVVSVALPLVLSVLTGLIEALVAKRPIDLSFILGALKPGFAAIGQFVMVKKVLEVKAAGAAAAENPGPTLGA